MIQRIIQRLKSRTFLTSLGLILAAEALVILAAWFLLDSTVKQWAHEKTGQAIRISQQVASSNDWSLIDKIPAGGSSPPFDRFHKKVEALSQQYFRSKNGSVYLAVIYRGEEYDIDSIDDVLADAAKANELELTAYRLQTPSYTALPISDESGTYLAAYTPIISKGKAVGLVAAEYDSAPLSDLQEIAHRVFWSIVPAILAALVTSFIFAGMFIEPKEVPRLIEDAKQVAAQAWGLTLTENEVFEALESDPSNAQIADKLHKSRETVKTQMSSILRKSGLKRWQLVVASRERLPKGA